MSGRINANDAWLLGVVRGRVWCREDCRLLVQRERGEANGDVLVVRHNGEEWHRALARGAVRMDALTAAARWVRAMHLRERPAAYIDSELRRAARCRRACMLDHWFERALTSGLYVHIRHNGEEFRAPYSDDLHAAVVVAIAKLMRRRHRIEKAEAAA